MQTITIHDAKTNLSKYILAAKQGKRVVIGGFGKPEVMLVKATPAMLTKMSKRDFSVSTGKVCETPDSFSKATEELVSKMLTRQESLLANKVK